MLGVADVALLVFSPNTSKEFLEGKGHAINGKWETKTLQNRYARS